MGMQKADSVRIDCSYGNFLEKRLSDELLNSLRLIHRDYKSLAFDLFNRSAVPNLVEHSRTILILFIGILILIKFNEKVKIITTGWMRRMLLPLLLVCLITASLTNPLSHHVYGEMCCCTWGGWPLACEYVRNSPKCLHGYVETEEEACRNFAPRI
ncbi:hypothetical protein KIN20_020628 [Parelaphostrongylus tenuis]|uniref:Uncharacterized protein n=1 Tax=Parelaphostrongylus tenuis TaxID=148309 RepID=A0AAD5QTM0_PARTN|nr:hypothetical protein KIN20_020627 [Parelaphostrongylus tenuis]KAJ1361391.1 hypothetical protein KIN20_020628 [Parelaphostrongylus tenuis]